ncbi:MAG: hypothetical protein KGI49_00480 [Patescibacteria group bacterium]|nr:hypothetical protein [Patescibacteria group bacterium]
MKNKPIKIYVLGSSHFMQEMVKCSEELRKMGYEGWIHEDYEAFVRGDKKDIVNKWQNGEHAAVKREENYLREHYQHILQSDAVLIVNAEKNGIKNYIGGNVLIEMGQAYVNDKRIYFLYDMPTNSPYLDEIESMDPICLHGDLNNIKNHEKTN